MSEDTTTPDITDETDDSEPAASKPLDWSGATIDVAEALRERGAIYGDYVNKGRSIPDIRDGLKAVQRRVIFSMAERNQVFSRGTTKCAGIVGDVMGKYHPHGDVSIYDALVRMGQWFSVNQPLIHPQGNFGSVDGDPPAAMRYTEAKMTLASTEWRADLRPEVVAYRPNFDGRAKEATVIPVTFPNLLVNGTTGIGWSLATDVPLHNLAETIDAALLLADNPDATLAQVMKKLPGPDYPSRGFIVNPDVLADAYASGNGTFRLQGRYHIERVEGGQEAVVITELPYQVGPTQVFDEVVSIAQADAKLSDPAKRKLSEIATGAKDKPLNLSGKNGIKLVIKCKRGGNVQALAAQLIKYTSLEKTQKINFTVLRDSTPAQVTLIEILKAFVDFRHEIVTKRLEYEKSVLLRDLRRLTALRAALDVIEKVIKIIRGAKDDDDARQQLIGLLKVKPYGKKKAEPIDREQAQHVLDLPLKRLNQLNQFQLDEEIRTKTERVVEIDAILADPKRITEIVKTELRDVKKRFGTERKTSLDGTVQVAPAAGAGGKATVIASMPKTDVTVFATRAGMAVAVEASQKIKAAPITVAASDQLAFVLHTDTEQNVDVFTANGRAYRVRIAELGIEARKGKGRPICAIEKDDQVAGIIPADSVPFIALVTAQGEVKKLPAEVFAKNYSGGMDAMGVGDQRIIAALGHKDGQELLVHTAQGKVLRTPLDAIGAKKTPSAGGMALMKLAAGDLIVSAMIVDADAPKDAGLLIIHESGFAKVTPLDQYPSKGRNGGGVGSALTDKPTKAPAGPVRMAAVVAQKGAVEIFSAAGAREERKIASAPAGARAVVSKQWLDADTSPSLIRSI